MWTDAAQTLLITTRLQRTAASYKLEQLLTSWNLESATL